MKKRLLALFIPAVLMIALSGCGRMALVSVAKDAGKIVDSELLNTSGKYSYNNDSEETENHEDRFTGMLYERKTDDLENVSGLYLKRGEDLYSLDSDVGKDIDCDYYHAGKIDTLQGKSSFLFAGLAETQDGRVGLLPYGDVPIPVLEEGDEVVVVSRDSVPSLKMYKAELYGYSAIIKDDMLAPYIYDEFTGDAHSFHGDDAKTFSLTDENGEPVKDWYNLEKDGVYTASWYHGTEYNEMTLHATGRLYVANGQIDTWNDIYETDYVIEGELTKEGFAKYDLSEVPAGVYLIGTSGEPEGRLEIR